MTRVVETSRDELRARRDEILHRLDVSYEALKERADDFALVGDEWDAWDELRGIAFLLGDE